MYLTNWMSHQNTFTVMPKWSSDFIKFFCLRYYPGWCHLLVCWLQFRFLCSCPCFIDCNNMIQYVFPCDDISPDWYDISHCESTPIPQLDDVAPIWQQFCTCADHIVKFYADAWSIPVSVANSCRDHRLSFFKHCAITARATPVQTVVGHVSTCYLSTLKSYYPSCNCSVWESMISNCLYKLCVTFPRILITKHRYF